MALMNFKRQSGTENLPLRHSMGCLREERATERVTATWLRGLGAWGGVGGGAERAIRLKLRTALATATQAKSEERRDGMRS